MGQVEVRKTKDDQVYLTPNAAGIKVKGYNGGGGSSDLSLAHVKVNNTKTSSITAQLPHVEDYGSGTKAAAAAFQMAPSAITETDAIMYSGKATFVLMISGVTLSVTGSAEVMGNTFVAIMGDCEITIS